jgi:glucokinase
MKLMGIDIGGSYLKVVDSEGKKFLESNPGNFSGLLDFLNKISEGYDGVGIAVAGFVSFDGFIFQSPNIPYLDGKKIEIQGREFAIANDATLACLGEVWFGAGEPWRKKGIVLCITLGTGLGGGAVIDGKPLFGADGIAMEVGHIPLVEDSRRVCACGRVGCTEEFVSARAISRYYKDITGELRTPEEIVSLANSQNEYALKALDTFSFYTAKVIQTLAHIFNPHAIIISGGVIRHFPKVLDMVKDYSKKLLIEPIFRSLNILPAQLEEYSGAYGALKLIELHILNKKKAKSKKSTEKRK